VCGIAGIVGGRQDYIAGGGKQVTDMLRSQAHRGPDAEGTLAIDCTVLGHRRLSILDLSSAGRQPMTNERGDVALTFNGEIYNYLVLKSELIQLGYHFLTGTDTEVIIHGYKEWGIDGLVGRLRGMFAFALHDRGRYSRKEEFLFLVRDRLGIKPLYYAAKEGHIAFASEVRALRAAGLVSNTVDIEAVAGFLCLGSVPAPKTWFRDARCLPAGSYLAVSEAGTRIKKYWDFTSEGEEPSQEDLAGLLTETVTQHMLADVPVGVFLSGGVDSAALAAVASRSRDSKLVTLTITFPEAEFSERQEARHFADVFGTEHREIPVSKDMFLSELPNILRAFDQPTADGVNTYFVSRAAKEAGLKVVLSGLGGDEIFLGYPHYRKMFAVGDPLQRYTAAAGWVRSAVRLGGGVFGRWTGQERWQRLDYGRFLDTTQGAYLLTRGFFGPRQAAELMGCSEAWIHQSLAGTFQSLGVGSTNGCFDAARFQYFELKRYLHDQLLRDSDVFSMAHSIELRVPLLDHLLVEAASRIPMRKRISSEVNKPALVAAAGHRSVREAAMRPKKGFTFPFAHWMRDCAGQLEEIARLDSPFEKTAVSRCWKGLQQGRMHWSRAWATVAATAI